MQQMHGQEHGGQGHGEPMAMMARDHYAPYRWVQAANAALGLWLLSSPVTFGYGSTALAWSDALSGVVVLLLAAGALRPQGGLVSWAQAAVGLWLLFAPLAFWAPDPVAYANDTLVGTLLITFGRAASRRPRRELTVPCPAGGSGRRRRQETHR